MALKTELEGLELPDSASAGVVLTVGGVFAFVPGVVADIYHISLRILASCLLSCVGVKMGELLRSRDAI